MMNPPPPVASASANAILDNAYGAVPPPSVDAAIAASSKRRKIAETLHANQDITDAELAQQEVAHVENTLAGLQLWLPL